MTTLEQDAIREELTGFFAEPLTAERFRRLGAAGDRSLLSELVFGQITWLKTLGRPTTPTLSAAFDIQAYSIQSVLDLMTGRTYDLHAPYMVTWHDGVEDAERWRVNFLVHNVAAGRTTHVDPSLVKSVGWDVPGGQFGTGLGGYRTISPHSAVFVKAGGPVFLQFEVVTRLFMALDADGVAGP